MIVCHRQGGAGAEENRKTAVTVWRGVTHQGEMITLEGRKQERVEQKNKMHTLILGCPLSRMTDTKTIIKSGNVGKILLRIAQ